MAHTYNHNIWKVEAGGLQLSGQSELHCEFWASGTNRLKTKASNK